MNSTRQTMSQPHGPAAGPSQVLKQNPRAATIQRATQGLQRQGALIALAALYIFGFLRYGTDFAAGSNISYLLADDVKYAFVALGMTFVILAGGIDLSVGSVALLGGVVAGLTSPLGLLPAFAAAIAIGLLVGAFNGFLIAKVGLEPFIVTLASLLAVRGIGLLVANRRSVAASSSGDFQSLRDWTVIGIPGVVVLMVVAFLIGAAVVNYTAFGRSILAIGGNEPAARLMGLPVERTKWTIYMISGACAAFAGALLTSQNGSIASSAGLGWELSAITAVVVGGTLLSGGFGSVMATLAGVVLLQLVFNLILFENSRGGATISPYWESVIRGAFLLVVVVLQMRLTKNTPSTHEAG